MESMRVLAAAGAAALLAAGPGRAVESPARVVALRAARLWDGTGAPAIRSAVVVVEGGRIRAAGAGVAVPAGAEVIDLGERTLLPGFIDCHTHLSHESSPNWLQDRMDVLRRTVSEQAIRATLHARRTVEAGFTTVRDLGSYDFIDVGLRNAIAAGMVPGPRMLVAVNGLGARGGHCDESGFPYRRFGEESGIDDGVAAGPDGFRDAVRFAVKYGADVIKTCASGGVLSLADAVDSPQLTPAELEALVDEAHRLGRRAAAHSHGAEAARAAIAAGIDSIEHGSFLDDEALRMMKERGTWLVPTCSAVKAVTAPDRRYPPEIAAKARAAVEAHGRALRRAIELGVPIALGTDAGVGAHGRNAEEFALLVQHGMSPERALLAGTRDAAKLLGLADRIGTIEAGKDADLVAVEGDPLADVTATQRVRFVMRGGEVVRDDLRRPAAAAR